MKNTLSGRTLVRVRAKKRNRPFLVGFWLVYLSYMYLLEGLKEDYNVAKC